MKTGFIRKKSRFSTIRHEKGFELIKFEMKQTKYSIEKLMTKTNF